MTIAVDDSAVVAGLSPYNWQRNGSTSLRTVNPGAYLLIKFTGTSIGVTFDVSALSGQAYAAGIYPVIKWTVDGVTGTRQLTSSDTTVTLISSLADTTHNLRLDLIAIDEGGTADRWTNAYAALVITALVIDTGKAVSPYPQPNGGYMICLGDSITEGAVTIANKTGGNEYAQVGDATRGYQHLLAKRLNVAYGCCAFSGEGWTTGVSNVPGLATSYAYLWSGVARTFTPPPNIAIVNMGTNGSVIRGTVQTFLTNLRSSVGASCQINLIVPFGQTNATPVTDGFNDYVAAVPTDTKVNLIDLGSSGSSIVSANSFDTVHPNTYGHFLLEAALAPSIKLPLKAGNPTTAQSGAL